ncbi:geranylgeranylglyceryl phosphate synthase [Ignicoccus islandicus DSM 13165]|uniref:Geranylgeranylglyceryl phosphate synthase n=1 Tax=Ignicoccus islandicus DSM 13165 TaxID=940295 RepID=A0A0U3FQL2_9CREN|nr:geranylgeranylglyceryl/heptaprenylglyceryl phosphate synthase [Ignicoccus islandicus]ALU11744.1 geranylgeranylglyceryl phosphate synthase [Ignicoccus islandicus DSM 13165]
MTAVDKVLLDNRGKNVFILLDPDKVLKEKDTYAKNLQRACSGIASVLVGGSTGFSQCEVNETIDLVRSVCNKPVIIFPGSPAHVTPKADAILFMSLLNSRKTKFIIEDQLEGSLLVWKYGLEALPTAYLIVGEGGTAGWIGDANPIPFEKPEILLMYVLAAKYLGFKYVYIEAGSGAKRHVPPEMVKAVKNVVGNDVFLIVGGGIRTIETAKSLLNAGADGIVLGTLFERDPDRAIEIINSITREKSMR